MKRSTSAILMAFIGLAIFSLARLGLYLMYPQFDKLSNSDIATTFIQGVRFDSSVMFIIIAPIMLMLLIPLPTWLKAWRTLWFLVANVAFVFFAVVLISDVIYFGYVGRHFSNELYQLANESDFIVGALKQYLHVLIIFLLFILFTFYIILKTHKISIKRERFIFPKILLLLAISFLLIRGTISSKPISTIDAFTYGGNVQGNLILNGVMTSYRYSMKSTEEINEYFPKEEAYSILNLDHNKKYPLRKEYESGERYNVVIIIMESWSSYFLGVYGANFNVTPHFDNLTREGVLYKNHYAMQKRSIDGIQAILTGMPRLEGMPSLGFGLEVKLQGNLGSVAKDNGYGTVFVQTSKRRSFYMNSIASTLGFDNYFGMEDYNKNLKLNYPNPTASVFGWDYEGLELLHSELDKQKSNFVGVFFSGTTHTPFAQMPKEYDLLNGTDADQNGFLNTLAYSDAALHNFMEKAKKSDWFDNTIFIITADHTLGKFEKVVFPEDYSIPMLIYAPKIVHPAYITDYTSHLDILPTIMNISGLSGTLSSVGRNVLPQEVILGSYNDNDLMSNISLPKVSTLSINQKDSDYDLVDICNNLVTHNANTEINYKTNNNFSNEFDSIADCVITAADTPAQNSQIAIDEYTIEDNSLGNNIYIHLGETSAFVTDGAYVHTAGEMIIDSHTDEDKFDNQTARDNKLKELQRSLLAYQQVIAEIFNENRW